MCRRSLLLVVPLIAFGLGERAEAVVVNGGTSAVFAFDLPNMAPEFTVLGSGGVWIGCNVDPCASVLFWVEDPDYERTAPPNDIYAKVGTGSYLHDLGIFYGYGGDYADARESFLEPEYIFGTPGGIEIPRSINTLYFTFMLQGDPEISSTFDAFYVINQATLDFRWGYGDGEWLGLADVAGKLYDPFTPVPVPGSLLFILSSIGASMVPAIRNTSTRRDN